MAQPLYLDVSDWYREFQLSVSTSLAIALKFSFLLRSLLGLLLYYFCLGLLLRLVSARGDVATKYCIIFHVNRDLSCRAILCCSLICFVLVGVILYHVYCNVIYWLTKVILNYVMLLL